MFDCKHLNSVAAQSSFLYRERHGCEYENVRYILSGEFVTVTSEAIDCVVLILNRIYTDQMQSSNICSHYSLVLTSGL